MNKIPRFGFIFTPFPLYDLDNIHDFGEATWNATGYSYGETAQEAIINACKYAYQDCTLWNLPRNPTGYLVEFYDNGDIEHIEQKEVCIIGEMTYTLKFAEGDGKTFFKATN